jgi:hypothetical protein
MLRSHGLVPPPTVLTQAASLDFSSGILTQPLETHGQRGVVRNDERVPIVDMRGRDDLQAEHERAEVVSRGAQRARC